VLFGNLQTAAAKQTGISPILAAASNSSGGVVAKAISVQSLAVAAATETRRIRGRDFPQSARLESGSALPDVSHFNGRIAAVDLFLDRPVGRRPVSAPCVSGRKRTIGLRRTRHSAYRRDIEDERKAGTLLVSGSPLFRLGPSVPDRK
jgi:hypothetical protein